MATRPSAENPHSTAKERASTTMIRLPDLTNARSVASAFSRTAVASRFARGTKVGEPSRRIFLEGTYRPTPYDLFASASSTEGKIGMSFINPETCITATPCCVNPAKAIVFPWQKHKREEGLCLPPLAFLRLCVNSRRSQGRIRCEAVLTSCSSR